MELGVARLPGAFDVGEQQLARGATDDGEIAIAPGQDAVGEDQQFEAERLGLYLLPCELENAANLGGIGLVRLARVRRYTGRSG